MCLSERHKTHNAQITHFDIALKLKHSERECRSSRRAQRARQRNSRRHEEFGDVGRGTILHLSRPGGQHAARQDLVWKLGLKGQITAGMIPGYSEVKDKMSAQAYFQGVVSRRIKRSCSIDADEGRLRTARPADQLHQRSRFRQLRRPAGS